MSVCGKPTHLMVALMQRLGCPKNLCVSKQMCIVGKPGPAPSVSDAEFVQAIVYDRKPVRSTKEIADSVGLSRQGARKHLDRLLDEGYVYKDKAGPATVWWPTPDGHDLLAQSDLSQ